MIGSKSCEERSRASLDNERENPSWSMSVLPYVLISDILSQLPMKKIFQFRRVCKAWRHLLSGQDSEVLQSLKPRDTLVLSSPKGGGENDILLVELEPGHENVMKFNYTKANLPNSSRLKLVGSCNGLLCLCDLESTKNLYIVNPMTGEYVQTPRIPTKVTYQEVYGFGFSQETNQYKVIRVTKKRLFQLSCDIYTLGTNKWRNIPKIPYPVNEEHFGVPLSGAIHWIADYGVLRVSESICAFDIDSEKVRRIPPPPNFQWFRNRMMLGVLGGSLSICDNFIYPNGTELDIWVMKIYGVEESWTKEFVIPTILPDRSTYFKIRPMMILKDGNVLIIYNSETLEWCDPRRKRFGNSKIKGVFSISQAVTYVANFGSLRDIVEEEYVRDLYVKSK